MLDLSRPRSDPNRAVAAVKELQCWLDLTIDEVADLVGSSKGVLRYWKRSNKQPRPGAARDLYRVHALVRAVRDATAPDPPLIALRRRPKTGGPSAYDLLLEGRYGEAEQLLRPLIFRRHEQPMQHPRLITWEDRQLDTPGTSLALSLPVRRARRVTLPK